MKVTIEDFDHTVTVENKAAQSIEEYVWVCFEALLANGCDPKNICESFEKVAEEIQDAWLDPAEDFNDTAEEDAFWRGAYSAPITGSHGFDSCPLCEEEGDHRQTRFSN
jgi:hypothetical protein